MKKSFEIIAVNSRVNNITQEQFVSLDMKIEKSISTNGCTKTVSMYANYACEATTLVVGSPFIFDDSQHELVRYEYIDSKGATKFGHRIKDIV